MFLRGYGRRFGAALFMSALCNLAAASEVSLDELVKPEEGKGVAIAAISFSGIFVGGSNWVAWRRVTDADGKPDATPADDVRVSIGGFLANERFSKTAPEGAPRRFGRLVALSLPPGTYEFYTGRLEVGRSTYSNKDEFSRRFVVRAGKVSYVGSMDLQFVNPAAGGGALISNLLFGVSFSQVHALPSLLDLSASELPLVHAAAPKLPKESIEVAVVEDTEARKAAGLLRELEARASAGDLGSKHRMSMGYFAGHLTFPDGSYGKVARDLEAGRRLTQELADKDVGVAAFGVAQLLDPSYTARVPNRPPADATKARQYFTVAASAYHRRGMERMVELAREGGAGQPPNDAHARAWETRVRLLPKLEVGAVPFLPEQARDAIDKYGALGTPKAFVLAPNGTFAFLEVETGGATRAILECQKKNPDANQSPCRLFAYNANVVWDMCPADLVNGKQMRLGLPGASPAAESVSPPLKDAEAYKRCFALPLPRAFAVSPDGTHGMVAGDCQSHVRALKACEAAGGSGCKLFAMDDQLVRE